MNRFRLLSFAFLSLLLCQSVWAQPNAEEMEKLSELTRKGMENQQLIVQLLSIADNLPMQKELQIAPNQVDQLKEIVGDLYDRESVQRENRRRTESYATKPEEKKG